MLNQQWPKMARKISMPPGRAPGFKHGRILKDGTRRRYWIARQVVRDTMGFPDPCIALPRDATDEEIGRLCHEHTARLRSWIAEQAQDRRRRKANTDAL